MDEAFREWQEWREATRDEPLEGMAAFFDARVGDYEAHMARWEAHYRWMARLLPDGVRTLLDLGCGTGLELDRIFERFPDLAVTGIDLSPDMLERLARKHAGKRLTLICADYFGCDLGENRFDAAVSFETLHHWPAAQKTALFQRCAARSSPAGAICNATTSPRRRPWRMRPWPNARAGGRGTACRRTPLSTSTRRSPWRMRCNASANRDSPAWSCWAVLRETITRPCCGLLR